MASSGSSLPSVLGEKKKASVLISNLCTFIKLMRHQVYACIHCVHH